MQKSITQIILEKYQANTTETSKKLLLNEANDLPNYETYFYEEY